MLKTNINKLDFDLKELFDEVSITERNDRSVYFFDILVEKLHQGKKVGVRVFIPKPQLEQVGLVKWRYLSDTRDSNSYLVERVSDLDVLANDINSVIVEKKLDGAYLESLQPVHDEVSSYEDEIEQKPLLVELLEKFDVVHLETHTKIDDHVVTELAHFKHNLKNNDKSRVELALKSAGFEDTMWTTDRLFVKYYV